MGTMKATKVKPFKADSMPEYSWAVWFNDETGKRTRRLFKTKAAATEFADDMEVKSANLGNQRAALMTDAVLRDAAEAWKLIEPLGVSLLDVVKDYASRAAYRQKNVTVRAMVDGFLESHRLRGSSGIHQKVLKSRLGKFAAKVGTKSTCDIKREDVSTWLARQRVSPATVNNTVRELRSCFQWAKEQGYVPENPIATTKDLRKKAVRPEPGILSVEDFARLLGAAHPDVLPSFAIGGFAGIRPDELLRLEWAHVRLAEGLIEVKGEHSKTSERRLVKIEPALTAYLAPYAGHKGKVCTPSWRRLYRDARRAVGFGKPGTETAEEKKQGIKLKEWPDDALRHSFASYHLAAFNDAAATALQMGHRGTATLFQHYRALVTPAAGVSWWALRPENAESKILRFA